MSLRNVVNSFIMRERTETDEKISQFLLSQVLATPEISPKPERTANPCEGRQTKSAVIATVIAEPNFRDVYVNTIGIREPKLRRNATNFPSARK